MNNPRPIQIVQGAQWGSEAKGAIAGYLAIKDRIDVAVRTGAVNAGHTVYYKGAPFKMQQLPVGWVNPNTQLVIGAGALVHPEILEREVAMVNEATGSDIRNRLMIDANAGIHTSTHTDRSTASGRHHAIGATGKGSSEALMDKIRGRGKGYETAYDILGDNYTTGDTADFLNWAVNKGHSIQLEATQGTLLDIHTGPYPYVTHKSTLPGAWMAECGLSPTLPTELILVVRTYPIRVAGNSGPMPMETSWPNLARTINSKRERAGLPELVDEMAIKLFEEELAYCVERLGFTVPGGSNGLDQHEWTADNRLRHKETLSELNAETMRHLDPPVVAELSKLFEFTTVTRKLRRVAHMDPVSLRRSILLNRPDALAITFMNYMFPDRWFVEPKEGGLNLDEAMYLQDIRSKTGVPVWYATYGPEDKHVLDLSGV